MVIVRISSVRRKEANGGEKKNNTKNRQEDSRRSFFEIYVTTGRCELRAEEPQRQRSGPRNSGDSKMRMMWLVCAAGLECGDCRG